MKKSWLVLAAVAVLAVFLALILLRPRPSPSPSRGKGSPPGPGGAPAGGRGPLPAPLAGGRPGVLYLGDSVAFQMQSPSAADCRSSCGKTPGCAYWAYGESESPFKGHTCNLLRTKTGDEKSPGSVSGPRP